MADSVSAAQEFQATGQAALMLDAALSLALSWPNAASLLPGREALMIEARVLDISINGRRVLFDSSLIRSTMDPLPVTPLPNAKPWILGYSVIRGVVHLVLDLESALLKKAARERKRWIKVDAGADQNLVLAVNGGESLIDLTEGQIQRFDPKMVERGSPFSSWVRIDGEVVPFMSLDSFLSGQEIQKSFMNNLGTS